LTLLFVVLFTVSLTKIVINVNMFTIISKKKVEKGKKGDIHWMPLFIG